MIFHYVLSESCTGLSPEWTGTVTETEFPVRLGTVVEVKCSESAALNIGSNKVTCSTGTEFSFQEKPSCVKKRSTKGTR